MWLLLLAYLVGTGWFTGPAPPRAALGSLIDVSGTTSSSPTYVLVEERALGTAAPAEHLDLLFVIDPAASPTTLRYLHDAIDLLVSDGTIPDEARLTIDVTTEHLRDPLDAHRALDLLQDRIEQGPALFRTASAANVVIVSDTWDPPRGGPDLGALEDRVGRVEDLAAFHVHALAPDGPCWEPEPVGELYELRAAGGEVMDRCGARAENFVLFLEGVLERGSRVERPVVAVADVVGWVAEVFVDGAPVGFSTGPSGRSVVLDGPVPPGEVRVELFYRPHTRPPQLVAYR